MGGGQSVDRSGQCGIVGASACRGIPFYLATLGDGMKERQEFHTVVLLIILALVVANFTLLVMVLR